MKINVSHITLCLAALFVLSSCENEKIRQTKEACAARTAQFADLQSALASLPETIVPRDAWPIVGTLDTLTVDYDVSGLDEETAAQVSSVKQKRAELQSAVYSSLLSKKVCIDKKDEEVMEIKCIVPIYVNRDASFYVNVTTETPSTVNIYNHDRRTLIKTFNKVSSVNEEFLADFSAIYLVEIIPNGRQYVAYEVGLRPKELDQLLYPTQVLVENQNCQKGDFLAYPITGITMKNLFEEPRKSTLCSNLHAIFSGSPRNIVAVQVPTGAKDILYNLKISTNESRSGGDDFYDDMTATYHEVKFLGLPLYESERGSGLISTMLGLNRPTREGDAYINMYVFYDAGQARKFQNGTPANTLKYNLDYSTLGTQSCNGRIPTRGVKTVYLGFENERVTVTNYVWLQALGSTPTTEYVHPVYSVDKRRR